MFTKTLWILFNILLWHAATGEIEGAQEKLKKANKALLLKRASVWSTSPKTTTATTWKANFIPHNLTMDMGTKEIVLLVLSDIDTTQTNNSFHLRSESSRLATVDQTIPHVDINSTDGSWSGNITVNALFLGATRIYVELNNQITNTTEINKNMLNLTITRKMRVIDHIFAGSVAILVSLLYINFGAALDLTALRGILRRPIGPTIGFLSQFTIMPVVSYLLGLLLFPNSVEMQLGLFFTGVSPSGGASNIWCVLLGGNLNLSVLMTTISNFAAFGMMPLWLFTLGTVIFQRGNMAVPYAKIATFAIALIVPLGIGLAIQRYLPRLTKVLVRLLKPISTFLILFIIIFAIVTNLYIFELFSWQIVIAGTALPWLGYILAWFVAKACRQNAVDALTIAIETGIQNTGISIYLLRFSLPQPQADLTTVIPVAVAIMTPFPLLAIYIYRRCTSRAVKDGTTENQSIINEPINT